MATTIDEGCLPFLKEEDRELVKQLLEAAGYEKQPALSAENREEVKAYWETCKRICREHNIHLMVDAQDSSL
ncbi:MAG: hypothetical protein AAB467_01085 [Patescibacteria group bacterium]